jgi:hypothetical protein
MGILGPPSSFNREEIAVPEYDKIQVDAPAASAQEARAALADISARLEAGELSGSIGEDGRFELVPVDVPGD